ncbi:MAG: GNAT family N-acetyltransferase [Vampirovibrio sp.]|nr:GNAT family N-acetyltransferase [Vampirovibrio sp.]
MAKQNYSIVGLLIGSVVKKAQNGTICRSYRIMPNETEIDYLISLRLDIKGTGSALVQDFLNRTAEFKTVVVRSEITKQAKNFYAKMGFKFLNKNPDLFIQEQQDKRPMERVLTHWTSVEEVAPMIFRR